MENFRTFEKASLEFQLPNGKATPEQMPNVTILLGNNGSGKSTVLKAIALAVLAPVIQSSGFVPVGLVRRRSAAAGRTRKPAAPLTAEVAVEFVTHQQDRGGAGRPLTGSSARILAAGDDEYIEPSQGKSTTFLRSIMAEANSPAFFMVGYGASRRVESSDKYDAASRGKKRRPRYERVSGLFEPESTMAPLNAFLPLLKATNPGRFTQVVHLIDKLLPPPVKFTGEREREEFLFETGPGLSVPYPALSDGYRAYIGWIGDMLKHICDCAPKGKKLVDSQGIVMVDEVDLHLHPEWQRKVVPMLATALPNIQFIFTTHSPIVTGTVMPENLIVMDGNAATGAEARQATEDVHGRTADEILLSSYFGLPTTRAQTFSRRLRTLSKQTETDREAARRVMALLARGSEHAPAPARKPAVSRAGDLLSKTARAGKTAAKRPARK